MPLSAAPPASESWAGLTPDLLDSIVQLLQPNDCKHFRLVCTAWQQRLDAAVQELRPLQFEPATICATFRSIRSLDISDLEDVNDHKLAILGQACSAKPTSSTHGQLSISLPAHPPPHAPLRDPHHSPSHAPCPLRSSQSQPLPAAASRVVPTQLQSPLAPTQIPVSVFAAVSPPNLSPPKTSRRRRSYRFIDPSASPVQPISPGNPGKPSSSFHKSPPSDTPSGKSRGSRTPSSKGSKGSHPQTHGRSPGMDRSRNPVSRARRMLRLTSQSSLCSESTYQDDSSAAEGDSSSTRAHKKGASHRLCNQRHHHHQHQPRGLHGPSRRSHGSTNQQGRHHCRDRSPMAESASGASQLRSLSLRNCWRVTNGGLQAVVGVVSLEVLDLGFCPRIDQQGIRSLSGLPHLKQLHLGGLKLCKAVLQALSHLSGLEVLGITKATWPVDHRELLRFRRLASLRSLLLHDNQQLINAQLQTLLHALPRLEHLDVSMCWQLTDEGIAGAALAPSLITLNLSKLPLGDAAAETISNLPHLRELNLMACHLLTDEGLEQLSSKLTCLETLDISSCRRITDEGIQALGALHQLRVLKAHSMSQERVSGIGFAALKGAEHLRKLGAACCPGIDLEGLQAIGQLQTLQDLNLQMYTSGFSLPALTGLRLLTGLRSLNVGGWSLDSSLLQDFAVQMPALTCLEAADCMIKSEALQQIPSMKRLQKLNLKNCSSLSQADAVAIASISNLQSLNLHYCRGLTDASLATLASLPHLSAIDISFCPKITDKGVAVLAKQAALSSLRLHNCKRIRIPPSAEKRHGQVDLTYWKDLADKDHSGANTLTTRISTSLRDIAACIKRRNSSPA
ncbi:hypothetical protein WJX74_010074 [Apatococcus lobatus]|uniref:F-box/LRR-repeat protein 15-like leucin rich repeat domain-containing protein n=1 Tax=Apatococcus lobatus TaxID=904363 RepID=A0AAW1QBM6_9CHLO